MEAHTPNREQIADLDPHQVTIKESEAVKGGAKPVPPPTSPVPIPYPNLSKVSPPKTIIPCV